MRTKTIVCVGRAWMLLFCMALYLEPSIRAQAPEKVKVYGVVYEREGKKQNALPFASVLFPDYGIGTVTKEDGHYTLNGMPAGKTAMRVQYLGKLQIDTIVDLRTDTELSFSMRNEDFKIKEIVVVAHNNEAGKATSSRISRIAMEHLQATSLYDLMALTPGGLSSEPSLDNARQITIRQVSGMSSARDINALGTAIIRDGAPVSNNSNLQAMNPTVSGGAVAMAGGASPSGGVDVRSIATENVESVEVIRGIPSVEHGDLTSGAVIIRTKAGREPLRIKAKVNPKVYQGSLSTGLTLGEHKGGINVSGDYAYNTSDPTQSYRSYQRASAKILYSNTFFDRKLRSNTSLDFMYGKDRRKLSPDDKITQTASKGEDAGITLNTNGTWNINKGWLKNVRYVLSGTYTRRNSYYQQVYASANAPYSMTTTDGTVLSGVAGHRVYDNQGNEITHFDEADAGHHAIYLPASYMGHYSIRSKEINVYAKVAANLFKQVGRLNNRLLVGTDFKSDGNVGEGKMYDPATPPYRDLSRKNATFRPRSYRDIPFVNQVSLFVEENANWQLDERELNVQAGVRYDHASVVGGFVSPRINASLNLIPKVLTLRGGYGITAKMPTLLYLHPENAYFEYVNINELADGRITQDERMFITTTKVYDAANPDLKIANNHKAELGFDLRIGKHALAVTAFSEQLKNGYSLDATLNTFKPFIYKVYERGGDNRLALAGSYPVLSDYYTPSNNLFVNTNGVEFDLNWGRIDAIRTSFALNGAWMQTRTYSNGYEFYDNSASAAAERKHIAIYEPRGNTAYNRQFSTTLRATHNLPDIGFVVTLTAQAVWQQSAWNVYGNDSIPVGYISVNDASVQMFKPGQYPTVQAVKDAGYGYMLQNVSHAGSIKETYSPYFCFNINLTKEVGDFMRVSFFANNMFRSYPRRESKRNPGIYTTLNNRFYFGLELSLTL